MAFVAFREKTRCARPAHVLIVMRPFRSEGGLTGLTELSSTLLKGSFRVSMIDVASSCDLSMVVGSEIIWSKAASLFVDEPLNIPKSSSSSSSSSSQATSSSLSAAASVGL